MGKTALVLIDIQNDYFPGGAFELASADVAGEKAATALSEFRKRNMSVIHIRHEALDPTKGFFLPGTKGAEIHRCVAPFDDETVIVKHSPNSFLGTSLEQELRALDVDNLVIVGMMTLMCVDATVRAACDMGFRVTVLGDACAARTLEYNGITVPAPHVHAAFLAALGMGYAVITETENFIQELN